MDNCINNMGIGKKDISLRLEALVTMLLVLNLREQSHPV